MKMCTLCDLKEGEKALVCDINAEPFAARRFKDIGLTENEQAKALFRCYNLRAYLIKGAVVAIRDDDAAKIAVVRRQ